MASGIVTRWLAVYGTVACPSWERGQVVIMKKQRIFFLLFVCVLLLAGCGGKGQTIPEAQSMVRETKVQVHSDKEESAGTAESNSEPQTEPVQQPEPQTEPVQQPEPQTEPVQQQTEPQTEPVQQQPEPQTQPQAEPVQQQPEPQTEPVQQPETQQQPEPIGYSPERVVQLATERTKAYGKTYIPDDLNRMLAEGTLTQADYDACYPTDGAGYLEYYVACDMNEARDVSGTVKFNSEADIAENIAEMYASLPQQYFYIEYHGTMMYGDRECYVFYCYRA